MKLKKLLNTTQKAWMLAPMLALLALCNVARADVKYTTVTGFALEGKMKPQTTVVTWMKEGLKRNDVSQHLVGTFVVESTTLMNAPKRQIINYCKATKMYHVAVLGPDGSAVGSDGSTSSTRKAAKPAGKPKTGATAVARHHVDAGYCRA